MSAAEDLGFIHGFDRYGRFRRFTFNQDKDKTDIEKALNELAQDLNYYSEISNQELYPRDLQEPWIE